MLTASTVMDASVFSDAEDTRKINKVPTLQNLDTDSNALSLLESVNVAQLISVLCHVQVRSSGSSPLLVSTH